MMANACDQDLGGKVIVLEDQNRIADNIHPDFADVVQPPDKGAHVACTRLCGEHRLIRRENQSYIGLYAFICEKAHGLQTL